MAVTYEKTFEIEIINELSASVYNRVLNYVLNHELNKNDSQLFTPQKRKRITDLTTARNSVTKNEIDSVANLLEGLELK